MRSSSVSPGHVLRTTIRGTRPRAFVLTCLALCLVGSACAERQGRRPLAATSEPAGVVSQPEATSRSATTDRLFIDQMTWTEVRDRIAAGSTTVLVGVGAVEQNGPYLATSKHNLVLNVTLPLIANKLQKTLIAPVIPFSPADVPEGEYFAGSIDLSEATFDALLRDVAENLRRSGFRTIVLIGESWGNQRGLASLVERLQREWPDGPRVIHVPEYYDNPRWTKWLEQRGVVEVAEGIHDDFRNSALVAMHDPRAIRTAERREQGRFSINGVPLDPLDKTLSIGRELAEYQATVSVEAIQRKLGATSAGEPR